MNSSVSFSLGRRACAALLATALAGCTGSVSSDPPGDGAGSATGGGPTPSRGPERPPGTGPGGGIGGAGPTLPPPAAAESAGPRPLARLTRREYDLTVRDLLGLPAAKGIDLPDDPRGDFGFETPQDVSPLHADRFLETAEALAREAVKAPGFAPCAAGAGEEACAAAFVQKFGRRAFRRPLAAEEADDALRLFRAARADAGATFADAISAVVQGFLQAPSFLYHRERGPGKPVRDGELVRLDPHEIASRLSYLLWGTMPDAALFAAADAGRLTTPEEVGAEAARLLADRRAAAGALGDFHRQWLRLGAPAELEKDTKAFPDFPAARASLLGELEAYVDEIYTRGDARLETLLTSRTAFVSSATAKLYGVSAPGRPGLAKVELDGAQRAGILTQLAFLAAHATSTESHPVSRGIVVWRNLLCGDVPAPPDDIPPPKPPAPNVTTRERFAQHAESACASCHRFFDPPGFAFERYDAVGRHRTVEAGNPVDASGAFALPSGARIAFGDAIGLADALAKSEDVKRCLPRQWFRYALGRGETAADEPSIAAAALAARVASGGVDLKALLVAITKSRPFLYRAPAPGEVL